MNTMESDGFTAGLKCTCRVSVLVVWLLFSWVPGSNPELRGAPPGCLFPDFLQSHEPGMGDWTWKYDGDTHVGHVTNGIYTICSKRYKEELGLTGERMRDSCEETRLIRTCVKKFGPNTFAVKHGGTTRGHTTSYQCIRYVMRSATVIQLAVSDRKSNVSGICDRKYRDTDNDKRVDG
ncbi:uncharacterized protein LOC101858304 [Aplysia californica]|uniref:Uncharacterized protein LOC101858304 n=1 Tax=Aplysia californica TaxID=6500 RepID=A0ABM0K4E7_APLCA|nr:uncharacterized protein LOC101858304 [Aplysia californica]